MIPVSNGARHEVGAVRPPRRARRRWGLAAAVAVGVGLGTAAIADAGTAVHQTTPVMRIDGGPNDGRATLVRTDSGVSLHMTTTVAGELFELPAGIPLGVEWEVGDATTNWFVVFNHPDGCTDPCGEDDVMKGLPPAVDGGPAGVSIHYAAGHVAGSSTMRTAGSLREGDTSGMLFGLPLQDAMTAEVHIVARSHGPMDTIPPGSERGRALNSLDGGCATNTCGDAQAAVFPPPS